MDVEGHVPDEHQLALKQLLDKYSDVFSDKLEELPPIMEGWHPFPWLQMLLPPVRGPTAWHQL